MATHMATPPRSLPASLPIREQPTSSAGRSDRTRNAPTPSRSANAMGQPPMGTDLPRENSAIINRIVVDDPTADLAREEARMAEGRPRAQAPDMGMSQIQQQPQSSQDAADPAPVQRSRHEHLRTASTQRREAKFGDYILGQTIGSGEFGKVKMGWKKGSTVQVAIKLIRKDAVSNTNRQQKIQREIDILRNLKHPNIVRLHEFVETERHMGIILEYASGGELFDYILTHRYLKDPAAKRLFAQLISGVGYLHSHGIVHRDLKLENLLLDRNKHIIITDFGFANTFNPDDELAEDIVKRITDKDFVKREGLDRIITARDGKATYRRGDLMQTSCGSPCYAAPELVVHDGLYTGRKVDVWSCGVILFAMLAGYLPFDDDPANPDGDNINLLYKYICSTPLAFPEFVTPHARDLLRRILVPEPRQRADLFEVARHSWLSEYSHVVGFIGSRVMSDQNLIESAAAQNEEEPQLGRSASVREPSSKSPAAERPTTFLPKHGASASMGGDEASDIRYRQRDPKRNTVQIEPPAASSSAYGERSPDSTTKPAPMPISAGKTRARSQAPGPDEVPTSPERADKFYAMQPPTIPGPSGQSSQTPRATSDSRAFANPAPQSVSRPNTSGTFGASSRLPSRGNSYSQPVAAQTNTTNAQGSFSQPKPSSGYIITGSTPSEQNNIDTSGRPQSEQNRTGGQFAAPQQPASQQGRASGHRRSSTLGSIADRMLNRSGSRRASQQQQQQQESGAAPSERRDRRYPPVSMNNAMPTPTGENAPRSSSDSRRPSFSFSRRPSRERDSSVQTRRSSRRFSWLPASFSMGNFGSRRDTGYESGDDGYRPTQDSYQHQQPPMSQQSQMGRSQSNTMAFGQSAEPPVVENTNSNIPTHYEPERDTAREQRRQQSRHDKALPPSPGGDPRQRPSQPTSPQVQRKQFRDDGYGGNALESNRQPEPVERFYTPSQDPEFAGPSSRPEQYNPGGNGEWEQYEPNTRQQGLRPQQKKFGYDNRGPSSSSNPAKKVMSYFRNKGRGKEGEAS